MLLEGLKELGEDLVLGALARANVWVTRSVIGAANVINVDDTIASPVQLLERFERQIRSELIHGADQNPQELVEFDLPVTRVVEALEESGQVLCLNIDAKVTDGLVEFVGIQSTAAIVVHDFKLAAEADYAAATTSS